MQLSLDVIDGLRAVSRQVANTIYWADTRNHFRVNALNANLPAYEMTDEGLVCFCGSREARIILSDVTPSKILSIDVEPPIKFNEHDTSVELKTWNNAGSTPLNYERQILEEFVRTETLDIITEISTAMKAKIGGGTPTFQAELEVQLAAKLGINKSTKTEVKKSDGYKLDVEVPKWTSVSLLQKQSISDVKQVVRMRCIFDAKVILDSSGIWAKEFDGLNSMALYLRGGGGGKDVGECSDLNRIMETRQFKGYALPLEHLELQIEKERLYRDVKTGEVNRTEVKIENPNRKRRRRS